jgi:predicted nucleotidyltransferase
MNTTLPIDNKALNQICDRYHIRQPVLFGSVWHGKQRPESDIDILVEFEAGKTPGLAFLIQ